MATSSSASMSSGISSSNPKLLQSPQTDFSLQLSQLLQQLGMSQNAWAQQQFGQASAVTDAQINNYLSQAQSGSDLAGGMLADYNKVFAPMQDQYAGNAASYASQGRVQNEMGRAESDQMQAGNKAKNNAESELQSFGIDPSSGRYQDLVRASDTANAAASAGAGETARVNTENQGQQRELNAIQMGQQLPGAAVNALNSAYQGIAGAENSELGLANTGVNLTTSPNQFLQTAQGIKLPPVGNTSTSRQGTSSGTVGGGGGGGGQKQGGSQGGGGGSQGGGIDGGSNPNFYRDQAYVNATQVAHPQTRQVPGSQSTDGQTNEFGDPLFDPSQTSSGVDESGFGDLGGSGSNSYGDQTYAPQDTSSGVDESGFGGYDSAASYDSGGGGDYYNSDDYSGYAKGGGVLPTGQGGQGSRGGGHVPSQMSPSGGQQTDDIHAVIPQTGGKAMLNADEFVIPKDVAMWKGQEFFQKMIAQSRKARMGAPAKPSQGQ